MSNLELITADVEHILLSRGEHIRLIFRDVEDIKEGSKYSSGKCPFCGEAGKFRISNIGPFSSCWRGSCEWGGQWHNWYTYASKRRPGLQWLDFYQELAREAGVAWPEPDAAAVAKHESRLQLMGLLSDAHEVFIQALWEPAGANVLAYLLSRGYTEEIIREMELGAYPGRERLLQALLTRGYEEEAIQQADLLSNKWASHPAILLWKDKAGRAMGLMGRAIQPDIEPKYLYTAGMSKSQALPGLERARRASEAILMESPLGAAYLSAAGISRPCIAIGGTSLSNEQLRAIQQAGIKRLILALDNDKGGRKATAGVIKRLVKAEEPMERLLVASWHGESGLDDLAMAHGLEAVETAVSRAERIGGWLASYTVNGPERPAGSQGLEPGQLVNVIFNGQLWSQEPGHITGQEEHNGETLYRVTYLPAGEEEEREQILPESNLEPAGDEERYPLEEEAILEQATERYLWLAQEDMLQARDFVNGLAEAMGLHPELLWPRLALAEERLRERESQERGAALLAEAGRLLERGEEERYLEALQLATAVIRDKRGPSLPEPYSLERMIADILQEPDGLATGLADLDGRLSIPRAGLSVIAAPSGQGKTTFMLNLLANWLQMPAHQEERFYFYSYEEPASHIALKLIMIWAGVKLHEEQNYRAYVNYLKYHRGEREAIEQAIQQYEQVATAGRLIIDYRMPSAEELAAEMALASRAGRVGAVIVDYIQRVPAGGRPAQSRQLELARTAQTLRETAVREGLAIITGSQLNEEGEVREARDIYHEAQVVLKLASKDKDGLDEPDMSITIAKQRAGSSGLRVYVAFERPILRIADRPSKSVAGLTI